MEHFSNNSITNPEIYILNNRETSSELKYKTNFNYQIIQNLFSNMSSLSLFELIEMRKNYKKLNYSLTEIDLQLLKLVSFPFYFSLMFVFSGIIMMNTKSFKNNYLKITIGLFLSVIIYYLNNFFYVMGKTEKFDVSVAIWTPLLAILVLNLTMIFKINEK